MKIGDNRYWSKIGNIIINGHYNDLAHIYIYRIRQKHSREKLSQLEWKISIHWKTIEQLL